MHVQAQKNKRKTEKLKVTFLCVITSSHLSTSFCVRVPCPSRCEASTAMSLLQSHGLSYTSGFHESFLENLVA